MSELRFAAEARILLDQSAAGGADAAEAFFVDQSRTSVSFDGGYFNPSASRSCGVGLRIFCGGRQGFASTTDLSSTGLDELVALALQTLDGAEVDPFLQPLPAPAHFAYDPLLEQELDISAATADRAHEAAKKAARALRSELGRNAKQASSRAGVGIAHVEIHNTNGLSAAYGDSGAWVGAEAESHLRRVLTEYPLKARVVSQSPNLWKHPRSYLKFWLGSDRTEGSAFQWARSLRDLEPTLVGQQAALRAASRHAAVQLPTKEMEMVFDPSASRALLSLLAPSFDAEAVAFGRSKLADQIGSAIAAPAVTIVDDGTDIRTGSAAPWDGEGVPTQRTTLVDSGVLRSFLHNLKSAARFGVRSTGNAARAGFASTPGIGPTTLTLRPGIDNQERLLARMGNGLLITSLNGLHLANTVTGDFSLGIEGFAVRSGEKEEPIREMTVTGNLLTLLKNVKAVGCDLSFDGSTIGAPSVWVGKLAVTGAEPALH